MTILSLNVWGGQKREALLEFLSSHAGAVDVFCLQEMTSASVPVEHKDRAVMTLDLAEQISQVLPDHELRLAPSRQQWGELLVLAVQKTLPVLDQGHTKVVTNGPPNRPSSKGAYLQFVRLTGEHQPITIANLHGYWEPDEGEDKPPRDEQVDNLVKFIDQQTNPVILCGDFNMNRNSRGIDRLSDRLTNLIRTHQVTTTRPAWNAYHGIVTDYMFVSPELPVRSFEVLTDDVSDHLALLVDVTI